MVIRTDESSLKEIWEEIKKGRLRQGWGITDMQLVEENAQPVPFEVWAERYRNSAKKVWKTDVERSDIKRRYRILLRMTALRNNDLVLVPKMPSTKEFVILQVNGQYWFDKKRGDKDFGHVIPIDDKGIKQFPYQASSETILIAKKLRGYQSAVNNVWDKDFKKAIMFLFEKGPTPAEKELMEIFRDDIKEKALLDYLKAIRKLRFNHLEDLVKEAFIQGGYEFAGGHLYDRKGGDVDLIFTRKIPIISDFTASGIDVFVQVKQKSGEDLGDVAHIDQIALIAADKPQAIKILISTADDFSEECQRRAEEENVMLVSGPQVAEILLKYL